MNAKVVEASQGHWWSVPQAIVWIVSGSEAMVERAVGFTTIASLKQLSGLLPRATGAAPPLSLKDGRLELMRAATAEQVSISGQRRGVCEVVPARTMNSPSLIDLHVLPNECMACIMEPRQPLQPDSGRYWLRLWIRPGECMRRWPSPAPPVNSTEAAAQSAPAASIITPALHSPRKRGVAGKDDSDLLAKVRDAMESNPTLALYAAVQRHCGEKIKNVVEAAYKRVKRKIDLRK